MDNIGWMFTLVAVIGTYINAIGNKKCFYVWSVSNSGFLVISLISGAYPQAALFLVNLTMCIVGLRCWKGKV